MAVGTPRRIVIDVNDLDVGERFWAAVTGLPPRFSAWQGQFSGLGDIETGSMLLQLVPESKTALKNRIHPDVTVADVERAVEEVIALGEPWSSRRGPSRRRTRNWSGRSWPTRSATSSVSSGTSNRPSRASPSSQ